MSRRGKKVTIVSPYGEDTAKDLVDAGYQVTLIEERSQMKEILDGATSNDMVVMHYCVTCFDDPLLEWCAASPGLVIIVEYAVVNTNKAFKMIPHLPTIEVGS
jgi:heterodisulfide reductase subunit A-like polyferredoxin